MNVYGHQFAKRKARDWEQIAKQLLEYVDHRAGCASFWNMGDCDCGYERAVADYLRAKNPMGGE